MRLRCTTSNYLDVGVENSGAKESYIWSYSANDLKFGVNNIERARITSSGCFDINNNSTSYRMSVWNSSGDSDILANFWSFNTSDASYIQVKNHANNAI